MERTLSNEIDQNLRTLRLFHPFNDALRAVFVKGIFVKPNAKAMPHVIHYLLMIYSPLVFRKKFRWPVTTKSDESDFRQATLTFFNELRSKYNWKIGPFKMQLILFPGGIEFMKLIHQFSNLVMSFELKRETSSSMHSTLTLATAKQKLVALQKFYENTQIYCRKLSESSQLVRTKVAELRRLMRSVTDGTTVGLLQEMEGSIAGISEGWDLVQHEEIEFEIQPMMAGISKFVAAQRTCADKIELIFVARKIQYDPMLMQHFVDEAKQLFDSKTAKMFDEIVFDQKINLNNLLECFALMAPLIENDLFQMKPLNTNRITARAHLLSIWSRKLDGTIMRANLTEGQYETQANPNEDIASMRSLDQFSNLTARIKSMLMNTPPIVEAKLKQPVPQKRPRIFSVDLVKPTVSVDCYAIGACNLSTVNEDANGTDFQPGPKRFCSSNFTSDTLPSTSMCSQSSRLMKTNAIEMLKTIQMKRGVEPLKNSRRSMMLKSSTQFTSTPNCQLIRVKAFGTLSQIPSITITPHDSSKFVKEKATTIGPQKESLVNAVDAFRSTRNRNRLSLDGA